MSKRETRKQKTANSKAAGRRKSHSRRSPGQKEKIWPINRTDYSNPNMPVRCFLYAAHALEKYLNDTKKARFQALGSYESYLEDNLPDSHFYADIIARFEEINGLYRKYDDCCISFDDLLAELNTANPKEIISLIYERLLEVSDIPHIANIENITDSEIEEIQAWASAQYERASEIADIDTLPDVISFGETIVIKGVDGGKASLSIGDNQISPDEGSEEVIDICFSNGDENTTSGYIKLTVGYLNFDEDGGAADGISDEVEYEYHDILKELDNFIYAQNCLIEKDTRIAEIISEAIKTNGDNT